MVKALSIYQGRMVWQMALVENDKGGDYTWYGPAYFIL